MKNGVVKIIAAKTLSCNSVSTTLINNTFQASLVEKEKLWQIHN